jgi:putative transposase
VKHGRLLLAEGRSDPESCKRRNLVERAFCRIKDIRRVATQCHNLVCTYTAAIALAAIVA